MAIKATEPNKGPIDKVQEVMDHRAEKKQSRSGLSRPKQMLSIGIDADVIENYRASGDDWQARMNAALRRDAGL